MGSGGKGGGDQTIGYHYYMSMLIGIGRPVDEITEIRAGDKTIWQGSAGNNAIRAINAPEVFGGEKKEGGVQGPFRVMTGASDQVVPGAEAVNVGGGGPYGGTRVLPALKALIGGLVPEFRGRCTLWFDGLICSINPYPKEWKFRLNRSLKGWYKNQVWYPEKARILLANGQIKAMNGAHILYECITNGSWGRGLAFSRMGTSWNDVADTLFAEGMGLCIAWYRKEDIDAFIQTVCDHIGGTVYLDRETGLIEAKLFRNDYDPGKIPRFDSESGLLDITEDDTGSSDASFNEVIVTGHDPITNEKIQGRAHNLAARMAQGAPATLDKEYEGFPTVELCQRAAQRDLKVASVGLRRFTCVFDRRAWRITPGSVFVINDKRRGLVNLILRAGEIEDAEMTQGRITIKATQDVFGLPLTAFAAPVDRDWSPPSVEALPPVGAAVFEAGYRDVYRRSGQAEATAAQETDAWIGSLAGQPQLTALQYDLRTRVEGEPDFADGGSHSFTATAVVTGAISATATEFTVTQIRGFDDDLLGDALRIGKEIMRIDAFDPATNKFTVTRGCLDTWPEEHKAGARVWLTDDDGGTDGRSYAAGETVEAIHLTRTSADLLKPEEAVVFSLPLHGRVARPYPPADVKIDDDSIFDDAAMGEQHDDPVLTWVGRNRVVQADQLVGFFEAPVAEEDGTTYRVRVYTAGNLLREEDNITSPWTYDATMFNEDGQPSNVEFELVAVRDGIESWPQDRIGLLMTGGWGNDWGLSWGGRA